jgi:hypothetical protein
MGQTHAWLLIRTAVSFTAPQRVISFGRSLINKHRKSGHLVLGLGSSLGLVPSLGRIGVARLLAEIGSASVAATADIFKLLALPILLAHSHLHDVNPETKGQ